MGCDGASGGGKTRVVLQWYWREGEGGFEVLTGFDPGININGVLGRVLFIGLEG